MEFLMLIHQMFRPSSYRVWKLKLCLRYTVVTFQLYGLRGTHEQYSVDRTRCCAMTSTILVTLSFCSSADSIASLTFQQPSLE